MNLKEAQRVNIDTGQSENKAYKNETRTQLHFSDMISSHQTKLNVFNFLKVNFEMAKMKTFFKGIRRELGIGSPSTALHQPRT